MVTQKQGFDEHEIRPKHLHQTHVFLPKVSQIPYLPPAKSWSKKGQHFWKGMLVLLWIVLFLPAALAQMIRPEFNFDSLIQINERYQKQDIYKLNSLNQLADGYQNTNPDKGLETADEAIALALKLNLPLLLAEAYNHKGRNHLVKTQYTEALELYAKAQAINESQKHPYGMAINCFNAGFVYMMQGAYAKALERYDQAQRWFEQLKNEQGLALVYYGLGTVNYLQGNFSESLHHYQQALAINERAGNKKGMVDNLSNIGVIYYNVSNYPKALEYHQKALVINEQLGNKRGLAANLGNIGNVYYNLSNYIQALDYHQKALTINEQIGAKQAIADNLGNMGIIYADLADYPKAIDYYQRALALNEQAGNKANISLVLGNMGYVYYVLSNYPKAQEYHQKALTLSEEIGDKPGEAYNLGRLGAVYSSLSAYDKALEHLQKALTLNEQQGDKRLVAWNSWGMGDVYRDAPDPVLSKAGIQPQDRYPQALNIQKKALAMAIDARDAELQKNLWQSISKTYEKQADFSKAFDAYKNYISLRDSIQGQEVKRNITRKELQFEFDKKESELKFEQKLTSEQLEKQRLLTLQQSQTLLLRKKEIDLLSKEKALQHLAFLKEQAEKQEKEQQLTLAGKNRELQAAQMLALKNQNQLKNSELQRSQTVLAARSLQRNVFLFGALVLLLSLSLIYRNYRKQRLANRLLDESNRKLDNTIQVLHETQTQLIHQEKLSSLGQLTAGVAHEIKNPLNFINNFSELSAELLEEMKYELEQGDPQQALDIVADVQQNMERILQHGRRVDGIVQSMLLHSRGGSGRMEPVNLNALVSEYVNLSYHGMQASKKNINVDIKFELDDRINTISLIAEDFSRVIINLCNNAFDALREKLSAEENSNYTPCLKVSTTLVGNTIQLSILDNGTGIPEGIRAQILQPFFTTKKGTEGTGLGLSITNDIIKAHRGKLSIDSNVGQGSEFVISLPC